MQPNMRCVDLVQSLKFVLNAKIDDMAPRTMKNLITLVHDTACIFNNDIENLLDKLEEMTEDKRTKEDEYRDNLRDLEENLDLKEGQLETLKTYEQSFYIKDE